MPKCKFSANFFMADCKKMPKFAHHNQSENTMDKDFNFKQVSRYWAVCYVPGCPRKDECLRYHACLHAPENRVYHKFSLPTMLKDGQCQQFRPIQKVRMAVGFKNIFYDVKERDSAEMRRELADYLGSTTTFYRYRNGEHLLTPRQQEWIRNLFRRYGYTDEVTFDDSRDVYIFD